MIRVRVSNVLHVEGLTDALKASVIRDLTLPNPEYVTRQRLGKWLGDTNETLCLVAEQGDALELPRGYLGKLVHLAKGAGFEVVVEDLRLKLPNHDFEFHGELRPYQKDALESMTKHGSGVLVAPCGSGKTAFACALVQHWRQPSLFLVHTRELLKQTCGAVERWLGIEAGTISEGQYSPGSVTVATVQTLAQRPEYLEEAARTFGLVILDEAQHSPASSFTRIMSAFPAAFRFGVTATPERRDGLFPFLEAVIGPVRHTVTAADLRDAGLQVVPRIEWVRTGFQSVESDWALLINELTADEERNELAVRMIAEALDDGRRVIVLSERVAHAERLYGRVNNMRPGAAALATGFSSKKQRDETMRRVRSGEARVLFATKLADEGLDLPESDTLFLLTPSRDPGRTTQRVGRVLRAVEGKPQPIVYDFVDAGIGMLVSQARTRFFECYRNLTPDARLPEWLETRRRAK